MALQLKDGIDVALQRNDATGKFDLVLSTSGPNKGNPKLESTRAHAVLTTLVSRKRGQRGGSDTAEGGYYFDPYNRRGSLLWSVTQDRLSTVSQLTAYADDAGQQLVELKQIATFTARSSKIGPGKYRVDCEWKTLAGAKNTLAL